MSESNGSNLVQLFLNAGPTAKAVWTYRVMSQNGREPNFDEQAAWNDRMERSISRYLNEHPEKEQLFAASMSSMAAPQNLAVARAYPFSEARVVMDVGGGNGHLLAAILRQHAAVKGILFDQPSVAEAAPANGFITAPDLNGRGSAVGGDMFLAIPKGADIYLLKSVLHDWDDERSVKILANCRDAMAPNSRILLVEGVIKPGTEPDFMKFVDLCMFVTSGGKERTQEEYTALLERAGLKLNRMLPTASALSILEAVRA